MSLNLTLTTLEHPDLSAIRTVLTHHGLHSEGGITLTGPQLDSATFETSYLGPGARSFYGQIFEAEPDPALSELVFALAVAGPLLVTVDPAPPHIIVCGKSFAAADVVDESIPPWWEVVVFVDTPAELSEALDGGWRRYRSTFADRYWEVPSSFL